MEYTVGKCLFKQIEAGDIITDYPLKFKVIRKNENMVNRKIVYSYDIVKVGEGNEIMRDLSKLKVFTHARKPPRRQLKTGENVLDTEWVVIRKHFLLFINNAKPGLLYDITNTRTHVILKLLTYHEVLRVAKGKSIDKEKVLKRIELNKEWIDRLNKYFLRHIEPYKL